MLLTLDIFYWGAANTAMLAWLKAPALNFINFWIFIPLDMLNTINIQ